MQMDNAERATDIGLTPTALEIVMSSSPYGVALLDGSGRVVHVNRAGRTLLGIGSGPLDLFAAELAEILGPGLVLPPVTEWTGADGTVRDIELAAPVAVDDERVPFAHVIHFRGTAGDRRSAPEVAAFASTVATMINGNPIGQVLDALAGEVRRVTGMSTCVVSLIEAGSGRTLHTGTSGLPDGFLGALTVCQSRGVGLLTTEAARLRRPLIVPGWRATIRADPLWEPAHAIIDDTDWDAFVAVPLVLDGSVIGTLAGFHPRDKPPTADDVSFLEAMAQHAALAVQHSRLLVEVRRAAVIDERNRLARDLHDSVSQTLFSLNLEVSALELDLRRRAIDESGQIGQRIAAVSDLASQAAADMRQLIFHLVPETLRRVGLISSIEQHAEALARRSKLRIDVEASSNIVCVNDVVERDVFLVVQEALHNAVKHARARVVTVRMLPNTPTTGALRLEIEDDGVGFDGLPPTGKGLGLASIADRAARHSGGLSIQTGPNGGTCLVVVMANAHH